MEYFSSRKGIGSAQLPYHPLQKRSCPFISTETNVKTGEEGFNYYGEFHFPCNTYDLKKKSVRLVAGLEVPREQTATG